MVISAPIYAHPLPFLHPNALFVLVQCVILSQIAPPKQIGKLIVEAGFPPGVVNILSGYGPTAGQVCACVLVFVLVVCVYIYMYELNSVNNPFLPLKSLFPYPFRQ